MAFSFSVRRVLALAVAAIVLSVFADATEVMHRPNNYKSAPNKVETGNPTPQLVHKRSAGKVQAAYFTNW